MHIMNPIIIIAGIGNVIGTQTFIPMEKEKLVLYALLTSVICNITLNLILIPKYTVHGAAVATLVSQGLLAGLELFWCREIVDLRKVGRYFSVYLGNALIMALSVFICVKKISSLLFSTFIAVALGVIIYGLLLVLEKNHFALDFINAVKRKLKGLC